MTNQTHDTVVALAIVLHDDQQAREIANQQDAPLWPHAAKSVRDYWLCIAEIAANSLRTQAEQSSAQVERNALVERLNDRLGGLETPMMQGDNISILLCSHFENPDQDVDGDYGWTPDAMSGCEEVLEAIKRHYAPTATALQLSSEREAKLTDELLPSAYQQGYKDGCEDALSLAGHHPDAMNEGFQQWCYDNRQALGASDEA